MDLTNKVINFMGDSITEGAGVDDKKNGIYFQIIEREYGLKKANGYGIGGTRLAYQEHNSVDDPRRDLYMGGRIFTMDRNADANVVYGGVNDYIHGDAWLGTPLDTKPNTFNGAVNFCMQTMKKLYPGKPLLFVTPATCFFKEIPDTQPTCRLLKKPDARELLYYVNTIIEAGKRNGVAVLDLYHTMPDAKDETVRATLTKDGLHWNDDGHKLLAKHIAEALKAL